MSISYWFSLILFTFLIQSTAIAQTCVEVFQRTPKIHRLFIDPNRQLVQAELDMSVGRFEAALQASTMVVRLDAGSS